MHYDSYILLQPVYAEFLKEARQASADMTAARIMFSNSIDDVIGALKEEVPQRILSSLWNGQIGPYTQGGLRKAGRALGAADQIQAAILEADHEAEKFADLAAGEVDMDTEQRVRELQDHAHNGARDSNDFDYEWMRLPRSDWKG